ncbi:hypothetical protein [uncultured Selenomonas sp.]|uniref:hypothetical protein n=1 Tax=uncultured Selenomonas sp. TaxID=159275 RepID=UPI0028EF118D|nr:hypothetical protein [uncultured Selenomonas sp.]
METVVHEEYAWLKEAQRAALERLSTLLCAYDDQVLQQKPYWEARYTEAFGALEQQCYAAFVRSSELRRRIALARAYMNRGAEPDAAAIDAQIVQEFHEYEEKLRQMEAERERAAKILKAEELTDVDAKRLKHLYRQLAKKLHPDLQPEQSAEMKRLWQGAMDAYALGDLARLEILAAIVESKYADADAAAPGDGQDASTSMLEEMRAALKRTEERIRKCCAALERLEQEHPFKHRALLENPRAIDERKDELKRQIAHYMAECKELEMQLAMMMQGRAEVLH